MIAYRYTKTSNYPPQFRTPLVEHIKLLLPDVSSVKSNVKLSTEFCAGRFCNNKKLMKLRAPTSFKTLRYIAQYRNCSPSYLINKAEVFCKFSVPRGVIYLVGKCPGFLPGDKIFESLDFAHLRVFRLYPVLIAQSSVPSFALTVFRLYPVLVAQSSVLSFALTVFRLYSVLGPVFRLSRVFRLYSVLSPHRSVLF